VFAEGGVAVRKLMWFSLGFTAAILCCAYLDFTKMIFPLSVLFGILFAILLLPRNTVCKVIAVVLFGLIIGLLYFGGYDWLALSRARNLDGENLLIHMEATDYSFQTGYGFAVDGKISIEGRRYLIRLYYQEEDSVQPGDVITADVRLRYTSEGGAQKSTYHKGEGIILLSYAENDITIKRAERMPGKYFPAFLRKKISECISNIFPNDTAAFAKALLLGDDNEISFQDNIAFQKSGIRHVIAVSGLHVSILFSIIYFVTGRKELLTLLLGFPVLFLFAAIAGFTPSVVRACVMQLLVILSMAVNKEYDPLTALSFAALVILVVNPLAVTSVSFQLSVGSMIGIYSFSGSVREYLQNEKRIGQSNRKTLKGKLRRWFIGSVSVSVSAMTVTLPLCAIYFGTVSLIGILTNLLTLWAVSFIFCGIIAACILSFVWLPLGSIAAWIVSFPIRYVLLIARLLSSIPFGTAYTDSPYTVLWIASTLILITAFLLIKKRSAFLLASSITCLYALSLFATWLEPRLDSVRLTVLDVGQGQCVLLQSKDESYLIDCGGDDAERTASITLNALGAQGIHCLDGLILTHYDMDHAGGAIYLTQVMPVDKLYLPDTDPQNEIRSYFEKENDETIIWVEENNTLSCGNGELHLFPAKSESEGNESSMCILFHIETCDILITGDRDIHGENQLLQQGEIPEIEVLVVGHHGASTSTGLSFLYETKPEIAVISVGENNIHNHPHRDVLRRLERAGCIIRRTDKEGTIIIRG